MEDVLVHSWPNTVCTYSTQRVSDGAYVHVRTYVCMYECMYHYSSCDVMGGKYTIDFMCAHTHAYIHTHLNSVTAHME